MVKKRASLPEVPQAISSAVLRFRQIRESRRLIAVVKKLIERHFESARHLFQSLNRRHGVPIFDAGDVAAQQSGTFLDIALREFLFFGAKRANDRLSIISAIVACGVDLRKAYWKEYRAASARKGIVTKTR